MSMKVNNTPPAVSDWQVDTTGGLSLHLKFAMLQFKMADANKTQALKEMKAIEDDQAKQKKIADIIQKVRNSKAGKKPDDFAFLDLEIMDYLKEYNIKASEYPQTAIMKDRIAMYNKSEEYMKNAKTNGGKITLDAEFVKKYSADYAKHDGFTKMKEGDSFTVKEWQRFHDSLKYNALRGTFKAKDLDEVVQALQAKLDTVGTSTQQIMVKVQDSMGKYNSYLGGANSAVQQGNQLASEVSKLR